MPASGAPPTRSRPFLAIITRPRLEVGVALGGGLLVHPAMLPERREEREHRGNEEPARDRPREEEPGVGVGHDRAHEIDLDLVAEDDAEDEGREREAEL